MLFNSLHFMAFFPLVVGAYYALPHRHRWALLLAASYYFYMCWKAEYAVLILVSTAIDYVASVRMAAHSERRKRRGWLGLSLASNLGILFAFKYFNFFSESVRATLLRFDVFVDVPAFDVLLPVGISFYTFQTLSYTIDVYRGQLEPERNFGRFAVYVAFFPQLVAGPIERASRLLPQFREEHRFDYGRLMSGLELMAWGFFKKVVIADRLSVYVNQVYNHPGDYPGLPSIVATYLFAFQIYCDFSGYSDIAIGSARVMGFDLMKNFERPYLSRSISEFWRRWHISLSTWFRDYLYIPLGGNRTSKSRWYANVLIVFVVSGLWHGANWTFVVWGALHGVYLVAALVTAQLRRRVVSAMGLRPRWHRALQVGITFHLVLLSWVFFRANSVSDAFTLLGSAWAGLGGQLAALLAFDFGEVTQDVVYAVGLGRPEFALSVGLIGLLVVKEWLEEHGRPVVSPERAQLMRLAWADMLVVAILFLGVFGEQAFIYFQF